MTKGRGYSYFHSIGKADREWDWSLKLGVLVRDSANGFKLLKLQLLRIAVHVQKKIEYVGQPIIAYLTKVLTIVRHQVK